MMRNKAKRKSVVIIKVTSEKAIKDYTNDPYFVKKREIASAFLKKVGLPESFTKPQSK